MMLAAADAAAQRVSVFGLGYVGTVTAACLAGRGHRVVGVDVQQEKVDAINAGRSPVVEPFVDELIARGSRTGHLSATISASAAIGDTAISVVCVGTPSLDSGKLNLSFVRSATRQIVAALDASSHRHTVIFRSTMLPGSTRQLCAELLAPLVASRRLQVLYCPEFLREGHAVADFQQPSISVAGTHDGMPPGDPAPIELFAGSPRVLRWEGAELLKYSCNYYHAIKVGFANEIGRLAKSVGEDGLALMDVLCNDTRLNTSSSYLRPGNAFGGSCLPKDVSALRAFGRETGMSLPLLDGTLTTNQAHVDEILSLISSKQQRRIGILGLAFKPDTDDLRGSPMVTVAETLIGRGYEVIIHDPLLQLHRLVGANAHEIRRRMPHLASLLADRAVDAIERSDVVVASHRCASREELASVVRADQSVIDLVGWDELRGLPWHYEGCCW